MPPGIFIVSQQHDQEEERVPTVTRVELLDHVETAFTSAPATRGDLMEAAVASQARPEVLAVLQRLPDVQFRRVNDLWVDLADLPIGV